MVNGFGESKAIPLNDQCVLVEVRENCPLITRYQLSRSTVQDMRMTLDLGDSDQMAKIAPDGKKWNRQGIKPHSKGIWNLFDCHVEEERINDVTEETN